MVASCIALPRVAASFSSVIVPFPLVAPHQAPSFQPGTTWRCDNRHTVERALVRSYRERFGAEPPWLPVVMYCHGSGEDDIESALAVLIEAAIWSGQRIRVPPARSRQIPIGMPWAMLSRRPIAWRRVTFSGP
ncbi:MAG: hypothetical protein R3293_24025 [Candidatus Promineifilaceae bacterium]|nr:hypothetical protein [Candidatus Promineifilaceae bacterium]